jgi:cell division transport system permease protein
MMSFFPLSMCLALVAVGTGLGFAGSMVSLRRLGERT